MIPMTPITAMTLPVDDWQFWAATAVACGALLIAIRPFLPRRSAKGAPCPGCPSGAAASRPKPTTLTIEGRRL